MLSEQGNSEKVIHPSIQCSNVHCTLYSVQCTLYIVHCTLYTVQCILYIINV